MSPLRKLPVALFVTITLLSLNFPISILADPPAIWIKTAGVNEITPALTEETGTFADDEASEFVHEIQSWGDPNFPTAQDALNWVNTNITYTEDAANYGVAEAWANPEQTLDQGSGDSEDLAFLLASLLKWHTDEVNTGEGDLVYAVCGFLLPPVDGFYAWVFWYDASEVAWHQLDPTSGEMDGTSYPSLGTLWLNDEYVFGFLPEYYPGPLPPIAGYNREDFSRIAEGGFGDSMNNYPWSMTYFNGDLYVGTGRNIPYMLGQALKLAGVIPPDFEFEYITHPRQPVQSPQWAEDMRAEIWRHGSWERVYRSAVEGDVPPSVPREWGFRQMLTFEGEIYAASGGGFLPGRLLLKSTDGATWEQVVTPLEMGTDSRAMAVHNGKLYVGTGYQGRAEVWASDSPSTTQDNWDKVADFSSDPPSNTAVVSLESFNGYLYAGTENVGSGYQVFRSDAQAPDDPVLGNWIRIVEYGGGDMINYWAGAMEVFNSKLYVGSMSLPLIVGDPVELAPPKGFELIRISTDDSWELVVGDYIPRIPPAGPTFRLPRSGWPGGFGNLFNFYCWSLQEDNGVLYLGTFDASSFLQFLPVEDLAELIDLTPEQQEQIVVTLQQVISLLEGLGVSEDYIEPFRQLLEAFDVGDPDLIDWEEVWQVFTDDRFVGGDLWKTEDGLYWKPVTLNGFDNPGNYGVRSIVRVNPLFVGMANPFHGLEIWAAPRGTIVIEKQTDPPGGTGFDFTDTITVPNSFSLDHSQTQIFNDVVPGTYAITETNPAPAFDLTDITCSDDNSSGDKETGVASVSLEPGETITCTFTNTQRGHIVVDKVTNPGGDLTSFDFTLTGGPSALDQSFSLTDAAPPHDSGPILPGSGYRVTETVPGGWVLTGVTCTDGSPVDDMDISPGEVVTCTFTNGADTDGDGVLDVTDCCPIVPNPGQEDGDNDGAGDACDNCVAVYNPDQADSNGNGIGDACEKLLTVIKVGGGGGSGTVTSDPAGIHCGVDCEEGYLEDTVVTLTARPGVKSYFVGWSGDCAGIERTTQVTMDADKTCTATFGYPVGGVVVPVNRLELLAPWLLLAALVVAAVGVVKRRRSKP